MQTTRDLGGMRMVIGDASFEVEDAGRGPVIVLLHGFPLARGIWDAQAAALSHSARVVRYDLRGLGTSGVTPGPYLMESLAGDLLEILDALDIERAAIVGHSLGGYVALAFYRLFAERCAGLGLVCSRFSADTPEQVALRLSLAARAEREGMAPVIDAFLPRFFAPHVYSDRPELVERARAIMQRTDPRGAAAMLRGMAVRTASDDLFAEMDLPVTVVAGTQDLVTSPEEAQSTAASLPDATLEVFECAHSPWYETPEQLDSALARLVRRCAERTAS